MSRLVSVGNVIVDLTITIPELPERGGDVVGTSSGSVPGGSFNTMVAAVRQGLPAAYGGAHGTGPFGEQVRAALAVASIAILHEPSSIDTGFDVALTDSGGERTFVTVFGAEATLSARALAEIPLETGDYLHVSGYGLLETTNGAVLAQWLPSVPAGVVVLVDPGPLVNDIAPLVWAAARSRADWLSCNLREAQLLTGLADRDAAAQALGDNALVRLGAEGCLLTLDGASIHVPGFVVAAVDTNGAGDAHAGAFLAALSRGATPLAAARLANACAALAVSQRGPATSPTLAELAPLIDPATLE
jgi:sugar/nucleoside kinase (ribokinase family)